MIVHTYLTHITVVTVFAAVSPLIRPDAPLSVTTAMVLALLYTTVYLMISMVRGAMDFKFLFPTSSFWRRFRVTFGEHTLFPSAYVMGLSALTNAVTITVGHTPWAPTTQAVMALAVGLVYAIGLRIDTLCHVVTSQPAHTGGCLR